MNKIRPSAEQVSMYLERWDSLENYVLQESSLRKLFAEQLSQHEHFFTITAAQYRVDPDIDQRLGNRDLTLVNDIAVVKVNGQKTINFYSFVTKYCSHHFPEDYPIYDSFVEKMLMHFKRVYKFYKFKKDDLKHYPTYHAIFNGVQQVL